MTAYAVAHLRSVDMNAEVVDYLRRIDATLDPFGAGSSCTACARRCGRASGPATSS